SESGTETYHPWPKAPLMFGDGYAYLTYLTRDSTRTTSEATAQPWTQAAYQTFEHLVQELDQQNAAAALTDLGLFEQETGQSFGNLRDALTQQNISWNNIID